MVCLGTGNEAGVMNDSMNDSRYKKRGGRKEHRVESRGSYRQRERE